MSRDFLALFVLFVWLVFVYYVNRTHKKLATFVLISFWLVLIGGYFWLKVAAVRFVEWQGYTDVSIVEWSVDCSVDYDVGFILEGTHPWAGEHGETQACFDLPRYKWQSSWIAQ